ncbi:cobalamin biosynthesis protein [Halorientalis brevis]|uniref:Cobalamin biosynthesis protein n=1 Tax=Halorientalis brevis TaxID=1126241 RepID=A0ABD6CGK0_9EURY|nr:cobalamin biosynthesis protein [Halorientalis brevis]
MSVETGIPRDLLSSHSETAYFWGRVVGDGDLGEDCVTVRTTDETAARRLAAIAGAEQVDKRIREREYAHDTALTRTEEQYTVQVFGDLSARAAAAFGLPRDGQPGGYRLDAFTDHRRQLLRGLLEGCGTICFKQSSGTVGLSFVADDRALLDVVQRLLEATPIDAPTEEIAETSSGGYWFGVADEAVPTVGDWLYDGSEETGLFAPSRRRKLRQSLQQAESYDVDP